MTNIEGIDTKSGPIDPLRVNGVEAPLLCEIADETVADLVRDMDERGIAVLPNYLAATDLIRLQAFAEKTVADGGGGYVGIVGKAAFAGTLLDAIADAPPFLSLMHRIYAIGRKQSPPEQSLYQVLRCIKGRSSSVHSYYFHFDSYVVTALLPIIIPDGADAGHLLMIPNLRRIRSHYWRNLIDKMCIDSKFVQRLLRKAAIARRLGFKQIEIVPGNLYFFWGYRTLHANASCDPASLRATALYHFADPHADSALRAKTGRAQYRSAIQKGSTSSA